jgi:hypothetical protein
MPKQGRGFTLAHLANSYVVRKGISYTGVGLYRTIYSGYFADNVNWFSTAIKTSSAAITSLNDSNVPSTTSYQILGYFKPATSEEYTLYLSTDDAGYLWIGNNAISGFTTENASINLGSEHGTQENSTTLRLVAGVYYPIRIQNGNNGGPGTAALNYSTPTIPKTNVLTGLISYNTTTNGF